MKTALNYDADRIREAVKKLPADAELLAVAAHVRAAIPFGTNIDPQLPLRLANELHTGGPQTVRIGSFTEQQTVALTERWSQIPWRLIPEQPLPAAANVALDELLCNTGSPSLRFWNWSEPAVILGRCQSVSNEVRANANIAVVRRLSGGGAMFVQPGGTISYSLILPEDALAGLSIRQSYEVCDAWVILALRELGVDVHHVPVNDLACWRGKIGGAAQARRRGMVLHHTAIAYRLDNSEMAKVLRVGEAKKSERAVASAAKVVSPLCDQVNVSREAVVARLQQEFLVRYGGRIEQLNDEERANAEELVRTKYGHPDWLNEFP